MAYAPLAGALPLAAPARQRTPQESFTRSGASRLGGSGVLRAGPEGSHSTQGHGVVGEGSADGGHGAPGQQVVQDRRGQRGIPLRRGDRIQVQSPG